MNGMVRERIKGAVTVLGDFVSADVVLPARYSFLKREEMAAHVLEEVSAEVNAGVRSRPIIVAGEAFGYGTGRESPARAVRAAGVVAVIGGPFARLFFRNAINNGILMLDCPALAKSGISDGDDVDIDIINGAVTWREHRFDGFPVPEIIRNIIAAGSLIDYGRSIVQARAGRAST